MKHFTIIFILMLTCFVSYSQPIDLAHYNPDDGSYVEKTPILKKFTFYHKWNKSYTKLDTFLYRKGIATDGYDYGCQDKMMGVILDTAALVEDGWLPPRQIINDGIKFQSVDKISWGSFQISSDWQKNFIRYNVEDSSLYIQGDTMTILKFTFKIMSEKSDIYWKEYEMKNAAEAILRYLKTDGSITDMPKFQLAVSEYLKLKQQQ